MADFACTDCFLNGCRIKHYVPGRGNLKAEVVFVLQNPSKRDSECGIPMVRKDEHELFETLLKEIGLSREQVFVTNLVRCTPLIDDKGVQAKPEDDHIEACHKHLERELAHIKPKVIVTMGALPAKRFVNAKALGGVEGRVFDSKDSLGLSYALSGTNKTVTKKGEKQTILFNKANQFKVIPTYSPAFVLRDPRYLDNIRTAFQLVKKVLAGEDVSVKPAYAYKYAHTESAVYAMLTEILKRCDSEAKLGFDIETSGFNWYKKKFDDHIAVTLTCAFAFKPFEVFGVVLRPHMRSPRVLEALKKVLEHPIKKGGHNGKFDNVFLRGELGIQVANFVFDTMLAAHLLDQSGELGLGHLSPIYRPDLGYYWEHIEKKYLDKSKTGYLNAPDDILLEYNCRDVDATMTLWEEFETKLVERGLDRTFNEIVMPHSREVEVMEYHGMEVDVDACIELGKRLVRELVTAEAKACAIVGRYPHKGKPAVEGQKPLNLGSTKQLSEVLFGELKLKPRAKSEKTGLPSVNEAVLEELGEEHEFPQLILDYRGLAKQLGTYVGWELREDGTEGPVTDGKSLLALVDSNNRIHTNISVAGTETGRTCVAGNTKLLTNKGCFDIEVIDLQKEPNLAILTHEGRPRKILRKIYKGREKMLRITLEDGRQIECTGGHRVLTQNGWKQAESLKVGGRVVSYVDEDADAYTGSELGVGRGEFLPNPPRGESNSA